MSSVGKPIQIVQISEDHEYILDEAALKGILLQEHIKDKPVVVISVAGAFRKGKSFLLNFLLHAMKLKGDLSFLRKSEGCLMTGEEGFTWKGGVNRVTCGILLWSEAFLAKTPSGEEVAVIFMDTQGVFDSKSTTQDNVFIFALGTMISSVQIFNIFNNIEENHLQHLQLFTEYSRVVAQKSGNETATPLQKMLFLVRDWMNDLDFAYGYEGGQQYLETWLQVTGNEHPELRGVRTNVRRSFTEIICFLMPHPGLTVASNRATHLNSSDVDGEFKNQLHDFMAELLSPKNLIPTQIGGQTLRASDLPKYFKMFVQMFNNKEVPGAANIYEATADVHNRAMADQCIHEFRSEPITGRSVEEIAEGNAAKEEKALESFGKKCMESLNSDQIRDYLAANLAAEVKRAIEEFEVKAEAHNKDLVEKFVGEYRSNPPSGKSIDDVTNGHLQRKTDFLAKFEEHGLRNSTVQNVKAKLLQDLEQEKIKALQEYERAADVHNKALAKDCMKQYRKNVTAGNTASEIEKCHQEQNDTTLEYFGINCMRNSSIDSVKDDLEEKMEEEKKKALEKFEATSDSHNKTVAQSCLRKFKSTSIDGESVEEAVSDYLVQKEDIISIYDNESMESATDDKIKEKLIDDLEEVGKSRVAEYKAEIQNENSSLAEFCLKNYRSFCQTCSDSDQLVLKKNEALQKFDDNCKRGDDSRRRRTVLENELEAEEIRAKEHNTNTDKIYNGNLIEDCIQIYRSERENTPLLIKIFKTITGIEDPNVAKWKAKAMAHYDSHRKPVENDDQRQKLSRLLDGEN